MPYFEFTCEICGSSGRGWREIQPPRFCGRACARQARANGLVSPNRRKYPISPEAHEQIKRIYQRDTGNGQVRALAQKLGIPRQNISRYALVQGWTAKQRVKEPDWTEPELEILRRSAHRHPEFIQTTLNRAGFKRSVVGIVIKRKRMRFLQNMEGQSATQLAACLGVDIHFVLRAIDGGRLKALKRGTKRTPQQGGDIYLIKDKWTRDYILDNLWEIDLRKVDKFWFVDLVAGERAQ